MSASDITKREIIKAFKQEINEQGFDKVTVGDISKRASVNRQTFYYHFMDKYDLVSYVCYYELFLNVLNDFDNENFEQGFNILFANMKKEQDFYINLLNSTALQTFQQYMFEIFKEIIERRSKEKIKKTSFEASFYASGMEGVILSWCKTYMKIEPIIISKKIEILTIKYLKAFS